MQICNPNSKLKMSEHDDVGDATLNNNCDLSSCEVIETNKTDEYKDLNESDFESAEEERESSEENTAVVLEELGNYEEEKQEVNKDDVSPNQEKCLDDDEDRRNPQYIPKKDDLPEKKEEKKKKVWKEQDRWTHDKFIEKEQTPKSREELVDIYGYDIRNEDVPPRARRRRKYGRIPNKYSRNWEDEVAYHKHRFRENEKIENQLKLKQGRLEQIHRPDKIRSTVNKQTTSSVIMNTKLKSGLHHVRKNAYHVQTNDASSNNASSQNNLQNSKFCKFDHLADHVEQETQTEPLFAKPKNRSFGRQSFPVSSHGQLKDSHKTDKDIRKPKNGMVASHKKIISRSTERRQLAIPPRLQDSVNRPKRYSSLRQRAVTESVSTFPSYYDCDPNAGIGKSTASHIALPVAGSISPTSTYSEGFVSHNIPNIPTSQSSHIFPSVPNQSSQPIMSSSFIAANRPILNYSPNPIPYHQYGFKGYPSPVPMPHQPQEIFSNGVAYYGPQHQLINRIPTKRPTAAIPILQPPESQAYEMLPEETFLQNQIIIDNNSINDPLMENAPSFSLPYTITTSNTSIIDFRENPLVEQTAEASDDLIVAEDASVHVMADCLSELHFCEDPVVMEENIEIAQLNRHSNLEDTKINVASAEPELPPKVEEKDTPVELHEVQLSQVVTNDQVIMANDEEHHNKVNTGEETPVLVRQLHETSETNVVV